VDARSALFDLYGDHLRARQDDFRGQVPVAALVRLLAPLGVHAPAVRTAVSRMVRQGWLNAVRLPSGPGYALTPRAVRRLDEAADRIYRTSQHTWDGSWHLLVVSPPASRSDRERLHAQLQYLGYGAISSTTWISPRPAAELDATLAEAAARAERFTAVHDGDSQALIARAWDLDGLARAYTRFLDEASGLLSSLDASTDEGAFAARSELVHQWRKFLFVDPGLPAALLPPDWPGKKAAEWFDGEADRLLPAARRFVDSCLGGPHV
jgi:phenylacetic acid degradation operon negative regulatory protein